MSVILDQAANIANLDPSLIAETVVRQAVTLFTTGSDTINDITYFMGLDPTDPDFLTKLDYYKAGRSIGRLSKTFFDITVNN